MRFVEFKALFKKHGQPDYKEDLAIDIEPELEFEDISIDLDTVIAFNPGSDKSTTNIHLTSGVNWVVNKTYSELKEIMRPKKTTKI